MRVTGASNGEHSAMRIFAIESIDDETVAFIGDPNARPDCTYNATLEGRKKAVFEPGTKCTEEKDGVEMISTVRAGSTIELDGSKLLVHLELDVKSYDRSARKRSPKPPATRMTVVVDATGRPYR